MTIEPGQRRAGLRGKLPPPRPDAIKLKFGDYLKRDKLPVLPPRFGHVTNTPPGGRSSWGFCGNQFAGNCVIAARCHQIMLEASATGRPIPDFSDGSALAAYSACLVYNGGKPWNPRDPSTDTGLDLQQAARWWRNVGLTDGNGKLHKIDAYVAVESVDDVLMATYLCGSCDVGLALPATAEAQFEAGQIWDDLKSKPAGGHCAPSVGWMGEHFVFVTWAHLQGAIREYVQVRMEDAVACLSREYMLASGLSPELIDWEALLDDVDSLRNLAASEPVREQIAASDLRGMPRDSSKDYPATPPSLPPSGSEHEHPPPLEHEPQPDAEPAAEHDEQEPEPEPAETLQEPAPAEEQDKPPPRKPKHKPPKRSHKRKR